MTCCNGNGWYTSYNGGFAHPMPCDVCNREGRSAPGHDLRVILAILAHNSAARDDSYARKPILATDCDYEIVRRSGVQGVRLPR